MFDAHNHLTNINSILCTSELLPQNITNDFDINKVATSEIGLDKRFENKISLQKQIDLLNNELNYAKENGIPVTLHCVQRTEALINTLKEIKMKPGTVIWHGFNGSIETAKELQKLGILISIGPSYNKDIKQLYERISPVLIESDYEGTSEEEHKIIILKMYKKVARITDISINELEEKAINATTTFENRITFR